MSQPTKKPQKPRINNFFSEDIRQNEIDKSVKDRSVRKFLIAQYPNVAVAKRELNVKTANQVYRILATKYYDQTRDNKKLFNQLPQLETKSKVKTERPVKRPYTVLISIDETKVYKKDKKQKQYHNNVDVVHTFVASSVDNLNVMIENYVREAYGEENDYELKAANKHSAEVINTVNKNVNKSDVRMRLSKPFKASFLKYFNKIDPVSYEDHNGECLVKSLEKHWGVGKKFKMM